VFWQQVRQSVFGDPDISCEMQSEAMRAWKNAEGLRQYALILSVCARALAEESERVRVDGRDPPL
jgi:hypothetical protein